MKAKKNHRFADLSRKQGTRLIKQSFLIISEGVNTEPEYFQAFRLTTATVKTIGQAKNTTGLVTKAIGIKDAELKKGRKYDQYWVVFDKDDFSESEFNKAISEAKKNGFNVAYSNQAFEFWFLLHFNLYKGPLHRRLYSNMLTKLTGISYNKSEGTGGLMYNRLLSLQPKAIRNASKLMEEFSGENPALEESSTTVYLLVNELNKYK